MILLHGWGFNKNVWKTFSPLLEQHETITNLDLLGFGDNVLHKKTLTLDTLVENVLKNAPEKANYCGWSLGGLVAMKIAIDYPERVDRLITISSTPKFLSTNDWPGMTPETMNQFAHSLKKDHQSTLEQFVTLQFQGGDTDRKIIRQLKQSVRNSKRPNTQALMDGLRILKNTDLRKQLKEIQCPQLYLYGRCDRLVPVEITEKIHSLSPNAKISIIPKISHAAFLSKPEICRDLIIEFLNND